MEELLILAKCDFMEVIDAPRRVRTELFLREHDSTVVADFLTLICGKQA